MIVEINDLNLKERIKILSDYSIIICTAGGTLANTIFCKPGKTIIEFMPEIVLFRSEKLWNRRTIYFFRTWS